MLVNTDVDAICAARIVQVRFYYVLVVTSRSRICSLSPVHSQLSLKFLQCLFTWDSVIHTVVPVHGKEDLETAYLEHIEGVSEYSSSSHSPTVPCVGLHADWLILI